MVTDYVPRVGDIVRLNTGVGVIVDIFKSRTTKKTVLQIQFAKNVVKLQPAEFIPLDLAQELSIVPTSKYRLMEELDQHLTYRREKYDAGLDAMLAAVGAKTGTD
jgi:hypothetical protein